MNEAAAFWRKEVELQERLTISGEFWADAVARMKRNMQHADAVELCKRAMPVPAAYRHILICLRALHRADVSNEQLLHELYRYAIEGDVLTRVPYVEILTTAGRDGTPGFNVSVIVWEWLKEQPIMWDYAEIGYERVTTLNQTDRRRLVKSFGEPRTHRDPFEVLHPLWDKGVEEWAHRKERRKQESSAELARLLGTAQPEGA